MKKKAVNNRIIMKGFNASKDSIQKLFSFITGTKFPFPSLKSNHFVNTTT